MPPSIGRSTGHCRNSESNANSYMGIWCKYLQTLSTQSPHDDHRSICSALPRQAF